LNKILFLLIFISCSAKAQHQSFLKTNDIALINNTDFTDVQYEPRKVRYMFAGTNWFIKYNPVSLFLGGMMYGYQKFVSAQIASDCAYSVSCSRFGVALIREYGIFKGIPLTADRLMRCSRISSLDFHPLDIDEKTGKVNETVEKFQCVHSSDDSESSDEYKK